MTLSYFDFVYLAFVVNLAFVSCVETKAHVAEAIGNIAILEKFLLAPS